MCDIDSTRPTHRDGSSRERSAHRTWHAPLVTCRDSSRAPRAFHRVRQAREFGVRAPERRRHVIRNHWLRTTDPFDLVVHEQRALVPTEILHGLPDLPVLDQDRPVAYKAGEHHGARIEWANVEEVRHEDAAVCAGNQLGRGLRSADEFHCSAAATAATTTRRRFALLLRPLTKGKDSDPLITEQALTRRRRAA